MSYDEKVFKATCASGSYNQVIAYLKSVDDGQEMLEKYKDIFEKGVYVLGQKQDESISDGLRKYEDYLKWVLVEQPSNFRGRMHFIRKWGGYARVKRYYKRRGYYVGVGFVAPYFNIMIWRKQTCETATVEIPEGKVDVNLYAIEEVITRGWLDYLSLGKTGVGGWATKNDICYFKDKYENTPDEFQISLLKHEAQHVFDQRKYPKMKSVDLEYRAKLVELIYHTEMKTFFYFLSTMSDNKNSPHGYAAGQIIKNLSQRIFGKELETNKDLWAGASDKISGASLELLKEHSKNLENSH
ncbi:MAG: hypothetical protein FWG63_06960 [Defluviitaleaceae bacterium]|nr:hypothetical protein [Defluviitaleaceae bacterium]